MTNARESESDIKSQLLTTGLEKIDIDLRFLVECLAEVLAELGETELVPLLPWINEPPPANTKLPPRLGQVYAIGFQLLNLVEENVSAQVRVDRECALGPAAEQGLWGSQLARLKEEGFSEQEIADAMREVEVEPVLTAHPTEAKRSTVLEQHRQLFNLLASRERITTPAGLEENRSEVKLTLERLWRTGEILLVKPEVASERRSLLYYFRDVYPDVFTQLNQRLAFAWKGAGFHPATLTPEHFARLKFGSWAGGDRDGHPFVTPEVTRETLAELREGALKMLSRALLRLSDRLTLSKHVQPPSPALTARGGEFIFGNGISVDGLVASYKEEPWRLFVRLLEHNLPKLRDPAQLRADLQLLHRSLVEIGATRIADADVTPVIEILDTFGLHLATLDIRQNSRTHELALSQIMTAAGLPGDDFLKWDSDERFRFLSKELESPRPFLFPDQPAGPEAESVLGCYRVLLEHIRTWGPDGIGSLIVSMTRDAADLLTVYALAREAGIVRNSPEGPTCILQVVPLFETLEDLERSPGIMAAFLANPVTQRSLRTEVALEKGNLSLRPLTGAPMQQVMLGYSDSNKESGVLASQWALRAAQLELTRVAEKHQVKLKFFHGRGGTISRGAGPTHRFLDALPTGTCSGSLRVTEQGEAIAQKYANRQTAAYNLELLLAGVTGITARHKRDLEDDPPEVRQAFKVLVDASRKAYRDLLLADNFMTFYSEATPIDALESSSIGSRPSRRSGQRTLGDLRAIPWVFSWTQSRFYLPAWFGVGSAFEYLREREPALYESLRQPGRKRDFTKYVLINVETNLASANLEIMEAYASLVRDEGIRTHFFEWIAAEFRRTQTVIDEFSGRKSTENRRPRMWKTLSLRADALRVLHFEQIHLLKRWRAHKAEGREELATAMLPDLLLSINAIASGLRTTG